MSRRWAYGRRDRGKCEHGPFIWVMPSKPIPSVDGVSHNYLKRTERKRQTQDTIATSPLDKALAGLGASPEDKRRMHYAQIARNAQQQDWHTFKRPNGRIIRLD